MAIQVHPMTGVKLNDIVIKRKRLTFDDAVTAHILRHQGETFTDVVQRLGTNANRVGEVFRGKEHPGSAMFALGLLTKTKK
ncbi:helix-turn-helix domain-containing protein [Sulfitobacter sp. M22]|uniref:helix-turn-helix domain-containing protein n=1 Tax=Sulfitobacter sp. M22 TaxID=2675332 RepID=UPI001F311D2F|nr:helix-turn-helix domain-containing protein [Sulfitobacter sp. M22]MCF7725758.1 hypothetical protein [Sulfitobacter sp. M22]